MKQIAMLLAAATLLTGCGQNMEVQPKYSEYSRGPLIHGGGLR
jgi:PBP1b-binding outer membrane lipoprotein LpoB